MQVQAVASSVRAERAQPSGHRTAVAGLGDSDLPEEPRPPAQASQPTPWPPCCHACQH